MPVLAAMFVLLSVTGVKEPTGGGEIDVAAPLNTKGLIGIMTPRSNKIMHQIPYVFYYCFYLSDHVRKPFLAARMNREV